MTPLPFTRANVLAVWAPRLIGWAIGSAFALSAAWLGGVFG